MFVSNSEYINPVSFAEKRPNFLHSISSSDIEDVSLSISFWFKKGLSSPFFLSYTNFRRDGVWYQPEK